MKSATSFSPAEALLKRAALRRTPVRVEVLDLLTRGGRPLSVPQILGRLKGGKGGRGGGADTVTVYRTLNTFVRKKLVHRVRGEDRTWLYAVSDNTAPPQHQHPHFVCDECGKVECLQQARIPGSLVDSLGIGREYNVSYPEVVVHGVCPRCQ